MSEHIVLFQSAKMNEAIEKISGKMVHLTIPPDIQFIAGFEVDEAVAKVLSKDPLLQEQKREGLLKIYNSLVTSLGNAYKEAHAAIVASPLTADDQIAALATKRQAEMDKAFDDALKEVQRLWAELVKSKKEYAAYKSKMAVRLAMDAVALTAAIASTAAAAASFGGTAVITILALIKTSVKLANDIIDCTKQVEAAVDDLKSLLEKVADACIIEARQAKTGSKTAAKFTAAKMAAKEVVALLEAEVIGTNFTGTLLGSLKDAKHAAKLAKQKVNGANVKAHKLAEMLNKFLHKQAKMTKEVEALAAELKKQNLSQTKHDKKVAKINKKLEKTYIVVGTLVETVPAQLARFKSLDDKLNTLLHYYDEIKKQKADLRKALNIIEKILALKDIALAAVDASSLAGAASSMADAALEMVAEKVIDAATDKMIQLAVDKYYGGINAEIAKSDAAIDKAHQG